MKLFLGLLIVTLLPSSLYAQGELSISAVQGEKNVSEHAGRTVRITGIVTARIRSGFFLQTPDTKVDANPATSEGIYVFTRKEPPAEAAVGSEVTVEGKIEEFRNRNENYGLTITEISHFIGRDSLKVISANNPLPKPVSLTLAEFKSNSIDQLERFEGMRVAVAELTTVAPTGGRVDPKTESVQSDGVFYAVIKARRGRSASRG